MKANIKDVANLAGVSSATVSHVINNTRFVSEATVKNVQAAIAELGYTPNMMARGFKIGKKFTVGFIVPDIANSFFSTLIEEIESVLSKKNYNLIVANTKETRHREKAHLRLLTSGLVDGLIVASTFEDFCDIAEVVPTGFPMVFIDRKVKNCPCDSITINNYSAIYKSVESLIKNGHKKIGYIAGLKRLSTTTERLEAYKNALIENNLPLDESCVQFADSMSKSAYLCVEAFVQNKCTAIVVSNNIMTIDTLIYLKQHGIELNKDISVVGYSDSNWDDYMSGSIDIISQPVNDMGQIAGDKALDRINDPDAKVTETILYSNFIPR